MSDSSPSEKTRPLPTLPAADTPYGKALAAWGVMLLVSIGNGALRDFTYGKHLSELAAHQISTLLGGLLLGLVIRAFCARVCLPGRRTARRIGLFWVGLTVAFEFLFFHYVGGHAWSALLANYNVLEGRVWIVLLFWIGIAPQLFSRRRQAA